MVSLDNGIVVGSKKDGTAHMCCNTEEPLQYLHEMSRKRQIYRDRKCLGLGGGNTG